MVREDVKKLQEFKGYPSITILVPTHRTMPGRMQDPIRVKDLIGQATDRLLEEFEKREVLSLIRTLDELERNIDYTKVLDGLAIFVSSEYSHVFDLPFEISEKVIIDSSFYLRDVIKGMNRSPNYWVLSLSHKPTRLYQGVRDNLKEIVDPVELQRNMQGFPFEYNYDVTSGRELLALATGDLDAKYRDDQYKIHFFRLVDDLFSKYYVTNQWPIILLGTKDNRAYFEQVTKHKGAIAGQIEGDFNRTPTKEIGELTSIKIAEYLQRERKEVLEMFNEAIGKLRHAFGVRELWRLAQEGRIQFLLVEEGFTQPASVNEDDPDLIFTYVDSTLPGISDDIVDSIIDEVLDKGGNVYFVDPGSLKEYENIAAILRY